jgi:RHS repeat-associated protein
MKFAGGHDTGVGVYHFGVRHYDPAVARWSQIDAIDQAGDLREGNRYAYAGDDPVNLTDLSGTAAGAPPLACSKTITRGCQPTRPRPIRWGQIWRRLTTPSQTEQEIYDHPVRSLCELISGPVPGHPCGSFEPGADPNDYKPRRNPPIRPPRMPWIP